MNKFFLISLMFAAASQSVWAKEMPEEAASSKPAAAAAAALKQPNRIYIEGRKIERAVYDSTVLKVERDTLTGSVYAVPLTKEKTGLFIVSDSGETHSLTLSPMDKITPQTIALKERSRWRRDTGGCTAAQTSLPLETQVQTLLKMIPTLSQESAESLTGAVTDGYLTANPINAWTIGQLRLERYRAVNMTDQVITVREPGFKGKGVVAIATEAKELAPKASADLWIIRESYK